jgi:signal transduction histidine kinase
MGEIMTVTDIDRAQASWEKSLFSTVGYRSHLILPIDWAGKRIAVLSIHSVRQRKWTTEQISLAETFCGFVAVVLENSGLYREAEERAKALEGLNQELQAALNVKMRFLGKVSHELRSPLCVIMGYANLLADQTFIRGWCEVGAAHPRSIRCLADNSHLHIRGVPARCRQIDRQTWAGGNHRFARRSCRQSAPRDRRKAD